MQAVEKQSEMHNKIKNDDGENNKDGNTVFFKGNIGIYVILFILFLFT